MVHLRKALIFDDKSFITKKEAIKYLLRNPLLSHKEISIKTYSSISYIKLIQSLTSGRSKKLISNRLCNHKLIKK
jgi:hypothetical protein